MFLTLLLVACMKPAEPPSIFGELPPIEHPELVELPGPTLDAAPVPVALKPGRPAPYVEFIDGGCKATHRATIVPEYRILVLKRAETLAEFYAPRLGIERRGREQDRILAQSIVADLDADRRFLKRDNRSLRWVAVGGTIGGTLIGIFLGALAASQGAGL